MKKHLLKSLLALALVLISGNAWGEEKTVTWTATSGALGTAAATYAGVSGTISTGDFQWTYTRKLISGDSYTGWTSSCIQLGKNGGIENIEFNTSAIPGTIKKVSVECSSYNNAHKVSISVGGTTYLASTATAKWTTVSAAEGTGTSSGEIVISFTDGARALYIKSISVTYEYSGVDPTPTVVATPSFDPAEGTYMGAQDVTLSCATDGATLYYTTDGTEATISSNVYDGTAIQVSSSCTINVLAVKGGLTEATASATYAIVAAPVVNAKNVNSNYFTKVTSVDDLEDGDAVLIVKGGMAMGAQNSNNRAAVSVTESDGVVNAPDSEVQKIVLVKSGNIFFFYTGDGYLYAASSSSNWLRTEVTADLNAAATISIDTDADATVTFQGENTRNMLRYNMGNNPPIFSCYASGQQSFRFYKEVAAPSQVPAALTFSAEAVSSAQKVDGTFELVPTPRLDTAEGYDGTITYESSEPTVATVDPATGYVTPVGTGVTIITATATETTGFTESSATYTLTIYEIEDGVFDFAKGNYLSGQGPSKNTNELNNCDWEAGNVTLTTAGRNCWYDASTLRLYAGSGEDAAGSITISVPSGYFITKMVVTGGTNLIADKGTKDGTNWTGYENSVVLTHDGGGTITLSSIVVTYTDQTSKTVTVAGNFEYEPGQYVTADYVTASFDVNVVVPAANTVYAVSDVKDDGEVQLDALAAGTVIGPQKGVIVYKAGGGDVTFTYTNTDAADITTELETSGTIKTTDYILSISENGQFGFCHPTVNMAAPKGKAYLPESAVPSSAPFLRIGGTTRIANAEAEAEKGEYFDLTGRKVEQPQRGIYIVGGRKVMVK